jgi:hypothetical protein
MSKQYDQNSPELAEVFTSIDPTQMRIARDMLEGAGIECFVFDPVSSRMLGTTAAVPSRLMVHGDRAEEAMSRLKDLGLRE